MSILLEKIQELRQREEKIRAMGGPKAIQKQHESNKLTARERLELFFDKDTFRELDMFVQHRCTHFDMPKTEIPGDGVIIGYGTVDGRPVFAFAQDFTARAGTLGEMHSKKICKVMELALKAGTPLVGFNDSGGRGFRKGSMPCSATGRSFSAIQLHPGSYLRSRQLWGLQPEGLCIHRR